MAIFGCDRRNGIARTVEDKIRRAQETGATSLDLQGLNLTSLPSEIAQLTQLTQLDLSSNQLTELPTGGASLFDELWIMPNYGKYPTAVFVEPHFFSNEKMDDLEE
jgi:Leucine-rich repeat (LRR) protein